MRLVVIDKNICSLHKTRVLRIVENQGANDDEQNGDGSAAEAPPGGLYGISNQSYLVTKATTYFIFVPHNSIFKNSAK